MAEFAELLLRNPGYVEALQRFNDQFSEWVASPGFRSVSQWAMSDLGCAARQRIQDTAQADREAAIDDIAQRSGLEPGVVRDLLEALDNADREAGAEGD